jgi:hypothetical protein
MFAGLIPDLVETGIPCILDCRRRLQPLFARSFPKVGVITGHSPDHSLQTGIAAHLPIGSLPGFLRPDASSFSRSRPRYLVADPIARDRFREQYGKERLLVGLAWHTDNPSSGHRRSIDLKLLAPILDCENVRWISLQYGDHDSLESEAKAVNAPIRIDRSVDQLADMDIFAAQIAALDLVITIDNSTAHLAGALGAETWVLLPFAPDWRWLQDREDSPWYPSMRLFRQPHRGDWPSVIQNVRKALSLRASTQHQSPTLKNGTLLVAPSETVTELVATG